MCITCCVRHIVSAAVLAIAAPSVVMAHPLHSTITEIVEDRGHAEPLQARCEASGTKVEGQPRRLPLDVGRPPGDSLGVLGLRARDDLAKCRCTPLAERALERSLPSQRLEAAPA